MLQISFDHVKEEEETFEKASFDVVCHDSRLWATCFLKPASKSIVTK